MFIAKKDKKTKRGNEREEEEGSLRKAGRKTVFLVRVC